MGRRPQHHGEGDVLVRAGAAVAASARTNAHRSCVLDPLLRREDEAVQAGLHSNPVKFDGIKRGIVKALTGA